MWICLSGTLCWLGAAAMLDLYGGQRPARDGWDAIVVAGCRVYPNGKPSPALARRVQLAVRLWRDGYAPKLVFTGGVGDHPPAEAQAASDLAHQLGVPRSAHVLEARSTSTEENARFASDAIGASRAVIVVTDAYHVLRCERVFGRYFARVSGVGSRGALDARIRGASREVAALAYYGLRGRL